MGNRITRTTTNGIANYDYDVLNRLINATQPDPVDPLQQLTETFQYDPVGNRTNSHLATGQVHDAANRLLEDSNFTYTYDGNGNLATKTNKATGEVTTYTYDTEDRLIRVDKPGLVAEYRYNSLGRRVEKVVNGVSARYIYDNEDILLELDGSNQVVARYTHGPGIDEPLIMARGGQSFSYHADGLGSVWDLTDASGFLARSYTYNSFGQLIAQTGTVTNPYTYTAREFDPETGLYYYRARYYSSRTGRFLSEDPAGFNGGVNFYSYVGNTPINATDPFGLYGTNSCDYYVGRCNEDGGAYYCIFAQLVCNVFPKPDDPDPSSDDDFEGFNRCTRQCLQDCDEKGIPTEPDDKPKLCELKESSNEDQRGGDPVTCHKRCFSICGSGKNPQF